MIEKMYRLKEAAQESGLEERVILRFIRSQWIVPRQSNALDEQDVARARLIRDLQEIFGVNEEAVPIILHLLDQLYFLNREIESSMKKNTEERSKEKRI